MAELGLRPDSLDSGHNAFLQPAAPLSSQLVLPAAAGRRAGWEQRSLAEEEEEEKILMSTAETPPLVPDITEHL